MSSMPEQINVLDNGYVKLVETWGSDERIIEAARMSTGKGFKGWGTEEKPGDEKLLRYLYEHKHFTPFEMAGAIFEIQAPIFVFREWHRHRTQSYNEMSARYIQLPELFYIPTLARIQAGKQGRGQKSQEGISVDRAVLIQGMIEQSSKTAREYYDTLLQSGLAKELARLVIPVNQYSRMRASANLRNWLAFLTLRLHEDAQWEIREYALAVSAMIQDNFPRTYKLFWEGFSAEHYS